MTFNFSDKGESEAKVIKKTLILVLIYYCQLTNSVGLRSEQQRPTSLQDWIKQRIFNDAGGFVQNGQGRVEQTLHLRIIKKVSVNSITI